jgi:hypothetical protein
MLGELGEIEKKLLAAAKKDFPEEFHEFVKQVASEIMERAAKKTPVKTTRLKEGWEFEVLKDGDGFTIKIINPVEYAEHVEYGHRIVRKEGASEGKQLFVPGVHMLEKALMETFAEMPEFIGNWLEDFTKKHILD